jgi:hypothetical protein
LLILWGVIMDLWYNEKFRNELSWCL